MSKVHHTIDSGIFESITDDKKRAYEKTKMPYKLFRQTPYKYTPIEVKGGNKNEGKY